MPFRDFVACVCRRKTHKRKNHEKKKQTDKSNAEQKLSATDMKANETSEDDDCITNLRFPCHIPQKARPKSADNCKTKIDKSKNDWYSDPLLNKYRVSNSLSCNDHWLVKSLNQCRTESPHSLLEFRQESSKIKISISDIHKILLKQNELIEYLASKTNTSQHVINGNVDTIDVQECSHVKIDLNDLNSNAVKEEINTISRKIDIMTDNQEEVAYEIGEQKVLVEKLNDTVVALRRPTMCEDKHIAQEVQNIRNMLQNSHFRNMRQSDSISLGHRIASVGSAVSVEFECSEPKMQEDQQTLSRRMKLLEDKNENMNIIMDGISDKIDKILSVLEDMHK